MSVYDLGLKSLLHGYRALFSRGLEVSGEFPLSSGPKIIAANHTTASDPIYLPYLLEEKTHCLFQRGLFAIPVLGWLFKETGQVCVDREHGHPAYEQACALLRAGETVAIFPEGRCCQRAARAQAKSGTVRMALETGAPIIPLGFYVRPQALVTLSLPWNPALPSADWQVTGTCYARFGKAWHPDPLRTRESQTEELMGRIYALVDQLAVEVNSCASPISLNPIHQW